MPEAAGDCAVLMDEIPMNLIHSTQNHIVLRDEVTPDVNEEKEKKRTKRLNKLVENKTFIPEDVTAGSADSSSSAMTFENACRNRPGTKQCDMQIFPPDEDTSGPANLQQLIQYRVGKFA